MIWTYLHFSNGLHWKLFFIKTNTRNMAKNPNLGCIFSYKTYVVYICNSIIGKICLIWQCDLQCKILHKDAGVSYNNHITSNVIGSLFTIFWMLLDILWLEMNKKKKKFNQLFNLQSIFTLCQYHEILWLYRLFQHFQRSLIPDLKRYFDNEQQLWVVNKIAKQTMRCIATTKGW